MSRCGTDLDAEGGPSWLADIQRNCDPAEKRSGPSSQRWGHDTQPYQALGKQPCEPSSLELQTAPRCACRLAGHAPPAFSPFCRIRESNTGHAPMAARLAAEGGGQLVNSCSWLPFACKGMASCVCEGLISDPGQSEGPCGGFLRTEAANEISKS